MSFAFKSEGNPVFRHKLTCDPSALVYADRLYLFTGHDEAAPGEMDYVMNKWLCFSTNDLETWTEHPTPLAATDFKWAKGDAFAAKVIQRNNLFYFYAPVSHATVPGKAIGVAVADRPQGPYHDATGSALITQEMLPLTNNEKANLDPTVLIDDDGQAYMFWGNKTCYFAKLDGSMTAIDGEIQTLDLPDFEEGAHIFKSNDWYYLCYGFGYPEKVAYAMSSNINGPWNFKGIVNEVVENCDTNRPCTIDFKGQSYFIYHNGALENGGNYRRSVCIDNLKFKLDQTLAKVIMTTEGVQPARDRHP